MINENIVHMNMNMTMTMTDYQYENVNEIKATLELFVEMNGVRRTFFFQMYK